MAHIVSMDLGGRTLSLETGRLAKQANASVLVRYGDTVVLSAATMAAPRDGIDFFPLLVDYEERKYAVGKIPGGWFRREGRPYEGAILAARLIDRTIRPLFAEGFRNDVQVVNTVMSVDQDCPPEIAAMIGASAALTISDIPFLGPIAGVRVGRVAGELVINPTAAQSLESDLDLVVAGTSAAVNMVEAGANELSEDVMLEAIMLGHRTNQTVIDLINKLQAEVGQPKVEVTLNAPAPAIDEWVRKYATATVSAAIRNEVKQTRQSQTDAAKESMLAAYIVEFGEESFAANKKSIAAVFENILKEQVRQMIIHEKMRPDGRGFSEIRPITCEVGLFPRTHGTGLFTRGQTQVCTVCTLGLKSDEQVMDTLNEEDSKKRYIHHYNFPAYSVGETRPARSPGRREIGHGALAERALLPMIPSEDEFYVIDPA